MKKEWVTTERILEFLKTYINSKFKNKVVIMDNAPSHRSSKIKEMLSTKNNQLLYSVPYRPKTNCIESWFNQFKHYLKLASFITFNELKKEVSLSIAQITKKSYQNYFEYAYNNKTVRKINQKNSTLYRVPKKYKIA